MDEAEPAPDDTTHPLSSLISFFFFPANAILCNMDEPALISSVYPFTQVKVEMSQVVHDPTAKKDGNSSAKRFRNQESRNAKIHAEHRDSEIR
jgi:hypothetical protein